MRNIIVMLLSALLLFILYKVFIIFLCKFINFIFGRIYKKAGNTQMSFSISLSIGVQVVFISIWILAISRGNVLGLTNLQAYAALCITSFFSVFWCYFSWDIEHIFVLPRKAKPTERRIKKIILYTLIYIFTVFQGYYQTMHAINKESEISALLSVANYSIVVGIIALDRIMNQIIKD